MYASYGKKSGQKKVGMGLDNLGLHEDACQFRWESFFCLFFCTTVLQHIPISIIKNSICSILTQGRLIQYQKVWWHLSNNCNGRNNSNNQHQRQGQIQQSATMSRGTAKVTEKLTTTSIPTSTTLFHTWITAGCDVTRIKQIN